MAEEPNDNNRQWKTISPYEKGKNYDEWARSVRTTLRVRKKFDFIDGTIKKPMDDSRDLEDWWTINFLLVTWI